MSVLHAHDILHHPILETEVESECNPQTQLPAEKELVPRVNSHEHTRVANRQSKQKCKEQEEYSPSSGGVLDQAPCCIVVVVKPDCHGDAHRVEGVTAWVTILHRAPICFDIGGHPEWPWIMVG